MSKEYIFFYAVWFQQVTKMDGISCFFGQLLQKKKNSVCSHKSVNTFIIQPPHREQKCAFIIHYNSLNYFTLLRVDSSFSKFKSQHIHGSHCAAMCVLAYFLTLVHSLYQHDMICIFLDFCNSKISLIT